MYERILRDAITFMVVISPTAVTAVFIALTRHETPAERGRIARRAVVIAAVILLGCIVIGEILLKALGISLPSFRISAGLVLLVVALKMILEEEPKDDPVARHGGVAGKKGQDLAVFPLAMPLIAGPGTVMAAVLLTDNSRYSVPEQAVTAVVLLVDLAITYGMLLAADTIHRVLGTTGANVLSRVMGLILAALSVEVILAGIRGAFSAT